MDAITIIPCDFTNTRHRNALKELMKAYMSDPMGNHPLHDDQKAEAMVKGLEEHPSKLILLAVYNHEFVGLTNCFINFATFTVKKFINIHDVIVMDEYRGKGIGKALMQGIIDHARKMDCSKITLEVRDDNQRAQALYKSLGFKEGNPIMHYWTKWL